MIVVDVNILVHAVNRDSPFQGIVCPWWERALAGDEPVGLAWLAVLGFLRLVTGTAAFVHPFSVRQALDQIEEWLSHPNVRLVRETEGHWRIFRDLLQQTGTAGNLTTDAHLAALAISHGATLASCDGDFSRFRHLPG